MDFARLCSTLEIVMGDKEVTDDIYNWLKIDQVFINEQAFVILIFVWNEICKSGEILTLNIPIGKISNGI